MKLSRGLFVIVAFCAIASLDFLLFFASGVNMNEAEHNLLLAFVLAWCYDEET